MTSRVNSRFVEFEYQSRQCPDVSSAFCDGFVNDIKSESRDPNQYAFSHVADEVSMAPFAGPVQVADASVWERQRRATPDASARKQLQSMTEEEIGTLPPSLQQAIRGQKADATTML
mmetsp:Transcript_14517/g.35155  ORF Transcript_14517/g.35155 Transcript_14517/m.35155 type:complete len:117 (+) Transcript_14517:3-353(+)